MIKLQNVSKEFSKELVLNNISLDIKEGECVVLCGVSGSGKSTLLSIIGSLMKPSSGEVEVDSLNLCKLSDFNLSDYRANSVGFVTQSFHLFDMLSVRDNVIPALLLNGNTKEYIRQRVESTMKLASIEHKSNIKISKLSGGEKQRCMIARALINNPKIILCDEPTANLDKENSLKFAEILKELKMIGKTIVVATHDPLISELDFVDKVIYIDGGEIE